MIFSDSYTSQLEIYRIFATTHPVLISRRRVDTCKTGLFQLDSEFIWWQYRDVAEYQLGRHGGIVNLQSYVPCES